MIFCSKDTRSVVLRCGFEESSVYLFAIECLLLRHSVGAVMSNINATMPVEEIMLYERTATLREAPAYRLSQYAEQYALLMSRYMTTDYSHQAMTQLADIAASFTAQAIARAIVDCRQTDTFNSPAYIGAVLRNANTDEVESMRRENRYDEYISSSPIPTLPNFVPAAGSMRRVIDDADRALMVKKLLRELEQ